MFFFFSKILEFFIYPLTWILACLIAGLIIKKQPLKKRLLIASAILLLIFTNDFLLNQFASRWDIHTSDLKRSDNYSCAIVLGGFSSEGKDGKFLFNVSADRFIQGLKLFSTGKVSHILISGGNGTLISDGMPESDWVKTQLKLFNVPDSCILIENRSRNTIENAAFTKPILQKAGLKAPYLLVTSGFHMRRSLGIFKKEQINVIPYPCNYMAGMGNTSPADFVPDGGALVLWDVYIKEVVGMLVNKLR